MLYTTSETLCNKIAFNFLLSFVSAVQVLLLLWYFNVHREIGKCFTELGDDPDCRVIVLSGAGKIFSAGESEQLYGLLQAVTACSLTQDHSVILVDWSCSFKSHPSTSIRTS